MRRRFNQGKRELEDFLVRFFPAGNYSFIVPQGCTEIDVFLVGGGGGGGNGYAKSGGGSGYTRTYKKSNTSSGSYNDWIKDGDAIKVTPGESIEVVVGAGGEPGTRTSGRNPVSGNDGGRSYIAVKNDKGVYTVYDAGGGQGGYTTTASDGYPKYADGGTGCTDAGGWGTKAQASYSDGIQAPRRSSNRGIPGTSQNRTTRDFGESEYSMNAGGTSGHKGNDGKESPLRSSGYSAGSGEDGIDYSSGNTYPRSEGGAGYGGAGGCGGISENSGHAYGSGQGGRGGDGTVVIRGKRYKK